MEANAGKRPINPAKPNASTSIRPGRPPTPLMSDVSWSAHSGKLVHSTDHWLGGSSYDHEPRMLDTFLFASGTTEVPQVPVCQLHHVPVPERGVVSLAVFSLMHHPITLPSKLTLDANGPGYMSAGYGMQLGSTRSASMRMIYGGQTPRITKTVQHSYHSMPLSLPSLAQRVSLLISFSPSFPYPSRTYGLVSGLPS